MRHLVDESICGFTPTPSWGPISKDDFYDCSVGYLGPSAPLNQSFVMWQCKDYKNNAYDWAPCLACNIKHSHTHSVVLKLSGVCDRSAFDQYYHLENDEEGYVIFYGFTGTIIRYDGVREIWNMSVSHKPTVAATSKAKFETLTLGSHEWEITDDKDCMKGVETKILTISSCSTEQYTCNDGLCVDLDLRCDGKPDCTDESDQLRCKLIDANESYQKFLTPPPIGDAKRLRMKLEVDLISIGDIQEIESTVKFQFTLPKMQFGFIQIVKPF